MRSKQDGLWLIAAALTSESLIKFRQYGIAVAFVLNQEKLHLISINESELFIETFLIELQKINTRVLLYNIERLFVFLSN